MSKWEIKKNSSSDGKSEVYENGVKIGTISKERGIPFISSDQAVVRNSSGDKIGIVSSQDDGVIGGLLGHKKTIVDDLRKKRISNPKQSQFPVETQSSIGPSYSGGSGNSGGSSYSPTISVGPFAKFAIGTATLFLLGSLVIEYIHPHRAYSVFKAVDDVVGVFSGPSQENQEPSRLEKKVESTKPNTSGGSPVKTEDMPTILLKDGKRPYHPNCIGKERTREVGEWNDGKVHCQGYALGKWNDANTHPGMKKSDYLCWNPAPNGTNCGESKVCLEGLCQNVPLQK